MDRLEHERSVQWPAKAPETGKPMRRISVGCIAGVPDHEEIIADLRDPMKSQVEVHALVLIVVLHKAEEGYSGVKGVLQPARHQRRRELSCRQTDPVPRKGGAEDHVATSPPVPLKVQLGAPAIIEVTPAQQ